MSADGPHVDNIPRPLLLGLLSLVLISLAGVTALRLAGVEPISQPPELARAETDLVVLEERPGGGVALRDPVSGVALAELAQGEDGFVRGVMRALARVRMQHSVPDDAPVQLVRWTNGKLSLIDPGSGWRIELQGFGQTNLETFAHLMSDIPDNREGIR